MPLFSGDRVHERAADVSDGSFSLSATSQVLLWDAIAVMFDRWRWETMSDSEWDTLADEISAASDELYDAI